MPQLLDTAAIQGTAGAIAALDVFSQHGYRGATLDQIAAEAGLPVPTEPVNAMKSPNYFKNRTRLEI